MSLSKLREDYEALMAQAENVVTQFPWQDRVAYAFWLAQSYYFVRHSSRLLALASGKATFTREVVHRRMFNHLKEEVGHEHLAALDIKKLEIDIETLPELVPTRLFYQSQYYWIHQHSSAAFLGYIIFLEGLASTQGPKILARVQSSYGRNVTRFLEVHAEEDQAHIQKAFETLTSLSQEELAAVSENMSNSGHVYMSILKEIREGNVHAGQTATPLSQVSLSMTEPANM